MATTLTRDEVARELEQNAERYPGVQDLEHLARPETNTLLGLLESLNDRWMQLTDELHRMENWADLTGQRPEDHPQYGMVASYVVECDRIRGLVCDMVERM